MKIAVLTSGGVDSSATLALLKQQGHDVTAFYLKIWLEDELSFLGECPWSEDLEYVEKLCKQLGVPLKIINLQKEYLDKVIGLALEQIKRGLTPNPDIFCNRLVKFGAFFDRIGNEYDQIATGHYAATAKSGKTTKLVCAKDNVKDQTYFLSLMTQSQLQKVIFPLGNMTKEEVRDLAQSLDLPAKNRKDSQGLCFLGKIKFSDFIEANIGKKPGDIVEFETGKKVGEHNGFWFHTIGQRKGLGLSGGPWFVVKKDPEKNIVYVSNKYHEPDKVRNKIKVSNLHWISGTQPMDLSDLKVKLRHGPQSYSCTLTVQDNCGNIEIAGNDQGISPGQFAVFYKNNECLGCGMIV